MKRMAGGGGKAPVATPDPRDKRFSDPEWSSNQFFDFIKQGYLLTTEWANRLVRDADGLDPHTRQKAEFYMRQIANAVAPSNFVLTNPELLRTTLASNAENLVDGMRMLADDIAAGHGSLRIRQSDSSMFEVGRNLGITPGKVIYQNDLMQLIQYSPTTPDVLKRPLLIVPPWINKFYILDLTPEKSFIKWCVACKGSRSSSFPGSIRTRACRTRTWPTTCTRARSRRSTRSRKRPAKNKSRRSAIASAEPCSP